MQAACVPLLPARVLLVHPAVEVAQGVRRKDSTGGEYLGCVFGHDQPSRAASLCSPFAQLLMSGRQ
eukprot:1158369-Pelagomonas_calceolata.AAC.9